jgi:hypothetical protein
MQGAANDFRVEAMKQGGSLSSNYSPLIAKKLVEGTSVALVNPAKASVKTKTEYEQ